MVCLLGSNLGSDAGIFCCQAIVGVECWFYDTICRKNYGGMGLKVKFEAISKLDVSFINER